MRYNNQQNSYNSFVAAAIEETTHAYTENGAKAKNTSSNDCVDFFSTVGALRSAENVRKVRLFNNAWNEDALTALRTLFYARDIRGGLGERDTFRTILFNLAKNHPDVVRKNLENIAVYGRWDDLYVLQDTPVEADMWKTLKNQFDADWEAYTHANQNDTEISLLAKWIRSGNESSKSSRALGIKTAHMLKYDVYDFKRMVIKLRRYLDVVESKMATNRWSEINYSHVPSRASMIYRDAFLRHDPDRYQEFIQKVANGEAKINTSTLYPYDIISRMYYRESEDASLQAMWDNLPDYVGNDCNAIVIADTSGSMMCSNGRPFFTAVSLAIYFAQKNRGAFHNLWMSFSTRPHFHVLKGKTLGEIFSNMDMHDWSGSTNLHAAFSLVLDTAIKNHVPADDIPKSLIIITDMEIDGSVDSSWSFYNDMKKLYAEHGYDLPNIVFWNVNSRHDIYHADATRKGVQLVSGQAASTFKTLMSCIGMTPVEYMNYVLNSGRYDLIQL